MNLSIFCDVCSGQKHKSTRRSSAGADKWLEVVKWNDTQECLKYIKNKGYKIVVAHVGEESIFIEVGSASVFLLLRLNTDICGAVLQMSLQ